MGAERVSRALHAGRAQAPFSSWPLSFWLTMGRMGVRAGSPASCLRGVPHWRPPGLFSVSLGGLMPRPLRLKVVKRPHHLGKNSLAALSLPTTGSEASPQRGASESGTGSPCSFRALLQALSDRTSLDRAERGESSCSGQRNHLFLILVKGRPAGCAACPVLLFGSCLRR